MHVPTYFLSDILMLQVDSLWTALHTEVTKMPNGTCICVLKDTSELINLLCQFIQPINEILMKLILISLIKEEKVWTLRPVIYIIRGKSLLRIM